MIVMFVPTAPNGAEALATVGSARAVNVPEAFAVYPEPARLTAPLLGAAGTATVSCESTVAVIEAATPPIVTAVTLERPDPWIEMDEFGSPDVGENVETLNGGGGELFPLPPPPPQAARISAQQVAALFTLLIIIGISLCCAVVA